jgi:hypothetical protein
MPDNQQPQANLTFAQKELQTIDLTKQTFRLKGFWQKTQEEQTEIIRDFLEGLKRIWEVDTTAININYDPNAYRMTGGGRYDPQNDILYLHKASLMTALHEFKHMLQFKRPEYTASPDLELDAQSWSHGIFRAALPKLYQRSLEDGKFMHANVPVFPFHFLDFMDRTRQIQGTSERNPAARQRPEQGEDREPAAEQERSPSTRRHTRRR